MYGTSDPGGDEASSPPNCPACHGKTYYVDPEQTVITCYDCGRYFRRKKPESADPSAVPAAPPPLEPPAPEPPAPEPPAPSVPPVPEVPGVPDVPPPPVLYPEPEPPAYEVPQPIPVVPEPPVPELAVPEPPREEEGDFDLVISEAAEEPAIPVAPEAAGEPVGCSICGFPMDPAWKVCPNCVSRYEAHCNNCGKTLLAWWLICPWCETPKAPDHIHTGR